MGISRNLGNIKPSGAGQTTMGAGPGKASMKVRPSQKENNTRASGSTMRPKGMKTNAK